MLRSALLYSDIRGGKFRTANSQADLFFPFIKHLTDILLFIRTSPDHCGLH